MTDKQPEALRLADELEDLAYGVCIDGAIELRRLHEENEELLDRLAQPEQKPVAWISVHGEEQYVSFNPNYDAEQKIPLYTAPPQQPKQEPAAWEIYSAPPPLYPAPPQQPEQEPTVKESLQVHAQERNSMSKRNRTILESYVKATKNSLNIYSFTAEALARMVNELTQNKLKWVSLTDKEINRIYENCGENGGYEYERAIEAKLKEKNS